MATIGKNQIFEIKNGDGTPFHNLVLRKSAVESVVMSLGDKISGDVYYKDNTLSVTMHEYITYNGVNYMLINPPTIVREGVVSGNSELKGMTKYSFVFYHPMCQLSNFPFIDVAVTSDETRYLSESKTFSWIGKPADFVAKMNKNLDGTEWIVEISSRFPQDKLNELSDVIPFDNATIADACKTFYDTWGVPYVVDKVASTEASYATGKRFKLVMGLPSNEIYENAAAEQQQTPFVFQMGHGVGLKNNSRTPRNNKIITRISGYGSENNIPYGYPQVRWYGTAGQSFTYGDHAGVYTNVTIGGVHFDKVVSYPIYKGILNGEYVELIKHPFTRTHLMPSVYRTTLFNKISLYNDSGEVNTDYDPDITLVDFYDAVYSSQYPYPNTINLQAPSYESHEFEDEKPELGEAHIISATPLNKDLTPASSWDDSLDDEGNYNQSYFQMVLPQLSFDLYACASITEEMQINMRSGACLGCTFTVQVDWDDYKRNFYDKDGNFAPNGSQRDLIKYPKSNRGSIALILQKDNSTFGTLMPNMYQYPNGETSTDAGDGDSFVILGISLPESYIFSAEWRLDEDMKSYMLENNVHYYDYPLKFDEDFLFHNENILSQIHPNTIVRFDYAGQTLSLFVKQLTIKYGDQPLPQYDITLTDNIEVTLNQIGQVAEDVESLSTLISILRQSYGKSVWSELSKKLSKVDNDIAYGDLDFRGHVAVGKDLDIEGAGSVEKDFRIGGRETVNEIQSSEYTGDGLLDTGYRLWYEEGRAKLVIDDLVARGKFTANELETRIWTYAGGNMVFSGAGSTLFFVEYLDGNENPLGYTYINQPWLLRGRALLAGGLAWSKRKAIQRELTEAEKAQVVKFRCYEYSDDGTMQTRNWWRPNDIAMCQTLNKVREKAASDGSYSGSASNTVYKRRIAGIGSKEIPMLNDGRVYDYVDMWNIYDLAGNNCKYKDLNGDEVDITDSVKGYDSTYHDWPAAGDVIVQMGNPLDTDRQSAVTIEVQGDVHGFKVYDTISDYSMANKLWVEIGYDKTTGKAKANVFGDAYIGARDESYYIRLTRGNGNAATLDIKAKINMSSPLGDTGKTFAQTLTAIEGQIDKKAETWRQSYRPNYLSDNVTPDPTWVDSEHVGDIWMDISANGGKKTYIYVDKGSGANPRYVWEAQDVPEEVFDDIDGKGAIYSGWEDWIDTSGNNKLQERDLFIPLENTTVSGVTYKAMKVYKCITAGANPVFSEVDYTDDTKVDNLIANQYVSYLLNGSYDTDIANAAAAYTHDAALNAVKGALKSNTVVEGGLMLTSLIALRQLNSGDPDDPSNYTTWAGISGEYVDRTTPDPQDPSAPYAKGHGIAAWYGGAMIDYEMLTPEQQADGWGGEEYNLRWAKGLDRMDGSGYRASGNISWDENGDVTLKGENISAAHYYLSDGTEITAMLRDILSMFRKVNVAGQGQTPVYAIEAQMDFYSLGGISALGYTSGGGGGVTGALYGLIDVKPDDPDNPTKVYGAQTGYVLTYGNDGKWYAASPTVGATTLNALTDVTISSVSDGQVLLYNGTSGKWINSNLPATASFGTDGNDYVPLTIGSTTKNLLTAHQSLSNYVTKTGSEALTNKTYNGYTLAAACAKGVTDNTTASNVINTDVNLITGRTLYYQLQNLNWFKIYGDSLPSGYVNGNTYNTLKQGTYTINMTNYTDSLIHFQAGGSASGLDFKWSYTQDSTSPIYYRKCVDSNRFAGTSWVALIDSLNIGSQSVNYATSAGKATNDSDDNAINTTYLKKSGGTMTGALTINPSNTSSFQDGIILNDKGTGGSEALTIKWTSGSYTTGYRLSVDLSSNKLIHSSNGTSWYAVLQDRGGNNWNFNFADYSVSSGIYYVNKDSYANVTNSPYIYGIVADFSSEAGHLQFGSNSSQNQIFARSYWWTARSGGITYPAWVELLHTGNYSGVVLPLSGGTMTGAFTAKANAYDYTTDATSFGISLNNSDLVGVNGIFTNDTSDGWDEGINFKRTNGNWDSLRALNGMWYIHANNDTPANMDVGLAIKGSTYEMDFMIGSGNVNRGIYNRTGTAWMLYFDANNTILNYGKVGIGTSSPSYKLHVSGDIYATGGVTTLSDANKKDVQGDLNLSVEQIAKAPAIKFLWKDDHSLGMQAGTIAQYWQKALPEVVSNKSDELSMQYGVTALVSTIITARKVVTHEEEIQQLKQRISELEKEVEYLKSA